jgi:hypothetical protein
LLLDIGLPLDAQAIVVDKRACTYPNYFSGWLNGQKDEE